MRPNLTHAIEDYIKVIHELSQVDGRATTNRIAERLGVTPASVTGMVKKLAATRPPLVLYSKHRGAVLTTEGERVALEIIRHHRLIELYLVQVLGYDWDAVHDEAERLEHVISEEFEERIARAFFIIVVAWLCTVFAMIPLWFAGAGMLRGFAITTIIGVSIGVFITRPAFSAMIENLLKKEEEE